MRKSHFFSGKEVPDLKKIEWDSRGVRFLRTFLFQFLFFPRLLLLASVGAWMLCQTDFCPDPVMSVLIFLTFLADGKLLKSPYCFYQHILQLQVKSCCLSGFGTLHTKHRCSWCTGGQGDDKSQDVRCQKSRSHGWYAYLTIRPGYRLALSLLMEAKALKHLSYLQSSLQPVQLHFKHVASSEL